MGCKKQSAIFIAPSPMAQIEVASQILCPTPNPTRGKLQTAHHRVKHEPVWRFCAKGCSRFPSWADCSLSFVYLAAYGGKLSAFANMLTICKRCGNRTWTLAWILLCAKTYFALSPLGRTKGRSGATILEQAESR